MNPYTSEADANKNVPSVKMLFKDLFPVTSQKIKELGLKDQSKLSQLLGSISVAPKRFNVSIVQRTLASSLEKEMSSKLIELKAC